MQHPNFIDKLRRLKNKFYLYKDQTGIVAAQLTAGVVNKSPVGKQVNWTVVGPCVLEKGSLIQFMGFAHQLNLSAYLGVYTSLFTILKPVSESIVAPGDIVVIHPEDRKLIYPQLP